MSGWGLVDVVSRSVKLEHGEDRDARCGGVVVPVGLKQLAHWLTPLGFSRRRLVGGGSPQSVSASPLAFTFCLLLED